MTLDDIIMQASTVIQHGIGFCRGRVADFEKMCKKRIKEKGESLTPMQLEEGNNIIITDSESLY